MSVSQLTVRRISPPEPALASEDLVQRALDLVPVLISRQAETEQRTYYSEETHQAFKDAGFYRMLVPRRFGGYEVDLETYFRVMTIIASGCPSTAWALCLSAAHAINVASVYDLETQAEIFGDGHFICAATARPQCIARPAPDGGWSIEGVYNYCSGSPYSTHFMSLVLPGASGDGSPVGPPMTFIAPRSAWTRLDDWGDSIGLKGSGSHSISFHGDSIPAAFVVKENFTIHTNPGGPPETRTRGDNPLYYGPAFPVLLFESSALAIGMIKGALDEYRDLMVSRTTMSPPIVPRHQDADYQRWYGKAMAKVGVAEAALPQLCREWTELSRLHMTGQQPFPAADAARLGTSAVEIGILCWNVMQSILFPTAGSTAARDGQRMQRIFRDMATARSHVFNILYEGFARNSAIQALDIAP